VTTPDRYIKTPLTLAPAPEDAIAEPVPFASVPTTGRGVKLKGELQPEWEKKQLSRAEERHLEKKTRPWSDDEYIYLDGVPHCYTPNREIGTVVHIRGRGSVLLRDLYVRNVRISGPFKLRLDDLYSVGAGVVKGNVKWDRR